MDPAAQSRQRVASVSTSGGTFTSQQQQQRPPSLISVPSLPKPDPPLLLLTGDELHVSPQGVARSCYKLQSTNDNHEDWMIQENYNLNNSLKSFVLSSSSSSSSSSPATTTTCRTIDIQEMDTRAAGTGGTTWEASIAMALYFARHPEQLRGQVVELGSGVGLGGILLHHMTKPTVSITLTDGSSPVLEQCRANIDASHSALNTQRLDWNDVLSTSKTNRQQQEYDTVLACDCAYRSQDVPGLATTLKSLLRRNDDDNNNDNKIHLFGPYNRAAYHEVIQWMENEPSLQVDIDWIELHRFRLAAATTTTNADKDDWSLGLDATSVTQYPFGSQHPLLPIAGLRNTKQELKDASQSTTKFLHVTATHKKESASMEGAQSERQRSSSLSDID